MCRFALYMGPAITMSSLISDPAHSIILQSYRSREREEPLNGDGFGVAWYVPEITDEPAILKDISPAWNNQNLINVARVTRSTCLLAHVRAATPGLPVTQLNCHPFGWRQFAFMHNGAVGGFRALRRRLQAMLSEDAYAVIKGSTDSEHLFALFIDYYRANNGAGPNALASALTRVIQTVEELRLDAGVAEPSQLNLAVTDGHRAAVTRFISDGSERACTLYVYTGSRYVCQEGMCMMLPPNDQDRAVLVASEPLSAELGWRCVPPNHVLLVHEGLRVELQPMAGVVATA